MPTTEQGRRNPVPTATDDETRQRVIQAATRCIAARRSLRMTMEDVAREAGVARSTLYRYFPARDDLLLGVLANRMAVSTARQVASLERPGDAATSISELILRSHDLVRGNPVNEVLFSTEGRWVVTALEFSADPVVDAVYQHLRPLLEQWRADGQLHADLDLHETTRWINAVSNLMLAPPLTDRSPADKQRFLDQYLLRALIPPRGRAGKSDTRPPGKSAPA